MSVSFAVVHDFALRWYIFLLNKFELELIIIKLTQPSVATWLSVFTVAVVLMSTNIK